MTPYRDKVVFRLALAVLGLIALLSLAAVWSLLTQGPPPPTLLPNNSQASKDAIENYKSLTDISRAAPLGVLKDFVAPVLLPVLTTLLGYYLGRSSGNASGTP